MLILFKKINYHKYLFIIIVTLFLPKKIIAQDRLLSFDIMSNPNESGYWWIENNNFGQKISDVNLNSKFKLRNLNTTYVIDVFSGLKDDSLDNIYFNESFIKHDLSEKTFLRIGRYYRDFSQYMNDDLSSGSMLISRNAQAMKKIGLVTSKTLKKNQKISFDFGIAHAIFDKNNFYNKAPLLHEKFLYMNIKEDNYQFSFGFIHEAVLGGSTIENGKQASKFSDFLKIIIAADDSIKDEFTHTNALGNHLGLWDFFFQKNSSNRKLKVYYQHFFEDTSGLRFANKIDGLWGFELENYIPNTNILIEYLDTTYQNSDPPYVDDGYYNHYLYKKGWSYKNFTLGNPFINPISVEPTAVLHLGISGALKSNYNYKLHISRDIHVNDNTKYKVEISKLITENYSIGMFILNNNLSNRLGFRISIKL